MSSARLAPAGLTRIATALAIGALHLGLLAPVAAADGGLEVTTPYPAVAVAPGSKVTFDLTVSSTSSGNVALALDSVPASWTASGTAGAGAPTSTGRTRTSPCACASTGTARPSSSTPRAA